MGNTPLALLESLTVITLFTKDSHEKTLLLSCVAVASASIANGATVSGGAGGGTSPNMGFTSTVDIGTNFGATGVTIETWYTDSGSSTWAKLFTFGTSSDAGLAYTNMRAGGGDLGGTPSLRLVFSIACSREAAAPCSRRWSVTYCSMDSPTKTSSG